MSTLRTYNLQNPDSASVNIELTSDGGAVAAGIVTASGIVVSAGSTSAPSISPSGDSNTGIFFPSADTVAVSYGGTEALRVDSSGRLGIGTNNPQTKLDIQGGEVYYHSGTNNNLGVKLTYSNGNSTGIVDTYGNHELEIRTNNSERARFTSNGLKFPSGLGIDFSATTDSSGTMTSELLSDYEEGTFSPFSAADVTNRGITIPNQAFYIKIGRTCYIWLRFLFSNTASSSPIQGTLPFAGSTPTTNSSYSPFFLTVFPRDSYPGSANGAVGFCYNTGDASAVFTFYQNNANYPTLNWNSGPVEYTVIGCYRTV